MKIRILFGLMYGIFGLICGSVAVLVFFVGLGLFWDFIFKFSTWPDWSGLLFKVLGVLSLFVILYLTIWSIRRGIRFGDRMKEEDEYSASVWGWLSVGVTVCALGFLIYMFMTKVMEINKKDRTATSENQPERSIITKSKKNLGLSVAKTEDGLLVSVHVMKSSPDLHKLIVQLAVDGQEEPFYENAQDIYLDFSKQKFNFEILYSNIASAYEEKYGQQISNGDNQPVVKDITIKAILELLPVDGLNVTQLKLSRLIEGELSASAQFVIECPNQKCNITDFLISPKSP